MSDELDKTVIIDDEIFEEPDLYTKKVHSDGPLNGQAYREIKELGRGAFGLVVLIQMKDGSLYAKKTISTRHTPVQAFVRELEVWKEISAYPSCQERLVCFYDMELRPSSYVLYMEYLKGYTLDDYIESLPEDQDMPEADLRLVLLRIVESLDILHSHGIAHNDLKPANVVFNATDLKLIDFGMSCSTLGENPDIACSGESNGTPFFISPEKAAKMQGKIPILTPEMIYSADIWALGVLAYKIAEKRWLFPAESINYLLDRIETDEREPFRYTPVSLQPFITKCTDPDILSRAKIPELYQILKS